MEIRLLGAVEAIDHDGRQIDVGRRQQRGLLGILLMEPGRVVTVDRLLDLLWDGNPPASGRNMIQVYVARLRRAFHGLNARIATRGDGYIAEVDTRCVDLHRFTAGIAAATAIGDPAAQIIAFDKMMAMWRGPFLAGAINETLRRRVGRNVEELRLTTIERRAEAKMHCGRLEAAISDLSELVEQHPTRELAVGQLMVALYRSGRQSDALAAFRVTRRHLIDELGVEPGPGLLRIYEQVLRNDTALDAAPRSDPRSAARPGGLNLLPRNVADFTGRGSAITMMDTLITNEFPAPVIITGMSGVGKTALAVRWAHQAATRFDDAVLYVNLRGYDHREPLSPLQALTQLLVALGVPADRVPAAEDDAAARYRALLADRNALVVLDNARSADQVRPLLPGGRHSAVLITSRDVLGGLVANDGARLLRLDVLPPLESIALLDRLLPPYPALDRARFIADLADLCGHLPLALRLAAATLVAKPAQSIAGFVAALSGGARMPLLAVEGDPNRTLNVIFAHSYDALTTTQQQVFRLLAIGPCVDYTVAAIAAIGNIEPDVADDVVAKLLALNMMTTTSETRFGFHDLIREYAAACADREDTAGEPDRSTDRLFTWYVDLATRVVAVLDSGLAGDPLLRTDRPLPRPTDRPLPRPTDRPLPLPTDRPLPLPTDRPLPLHDDRSDVLAFMDAEVPNLLAVIQHASDRHRYEIVWQISNPLFQYLDRGRDVAVAMTIGRIAVSATIAMRDPIAERKARGSLAVFYNNARRPGDALDQLKHALELARLQGNRRAEASIRNNMGIAYRALKQSDEALEAFRDALDLLGDEPTGKCATLNNFGNAHHTLGDFGSARVFLEQALDVARSSGNPRDQAMSLDNIGCVHISTGRLPDAITYLTDALALATAAGATRFETIIRCDLARAHRAHADSTAAKAQLDVALALSRRAGDTQRERSIHIALAEVDAAAHDVDAARVHLMAAWWISELDADPDEQDRLERLTDELIESRDASAAATSLTAGAQMHESATR